VDGVIKIMCSTCLLSKTCPLTIDVNVFDGQAQRRLSGSNSTTADVEFVAMLSYTTDEFVATWQSVDSLSLASVQRSWKVLLTAMVAVGFAAAGALWGMRADEETAKRVAMEKNSLVISEMDSKTATSHGARLKNP
jgi:hypothetical protein